MTYRKGNKITALVVEDEERIAAGICNKITGMDDSFEIIGRASNGEEALEIIENLHPQVVFTDIAMPVMDGMELAKNIRRNSPNTIVVIISGFSDFTYAQQSMKYGVFNYLLKPLQDDALQETLFDIKKSLSRFNVRENRHILYSDGYEVASGDSEEFLLAHISVGNVIYNMADEEVMKFYSFNCDQIKWNKIMQELFDEEIQWFMADDHAPNQKMIAVKIKNAPKEELFHMMARIPSIVQEYTVLPVSICSTREGVPQAEIWEYTKRLRHIMKQRLVIGRNCCFYLEDDEQYINNMLEIVKMKLSTYIKNYFISTNLENFMNEMQTVFKYMESNHATQENIEKICLYVMKLLEVTKGDQESGLLEEIQGNLIRSISVSVSEKELFENLLQEFRRVNQYMENIYDDDVEVRLLDYVNEHYLSIESVEQVAEEFGYNYTYLSRLFKKKVGESMNRYITVKKMELAKELLKENRNMTLAEVSEMCGYNDYRYFSRVFKSETGFSPSDYREL